MKGIQLASAVLSALLIGASIPAAEAAGMDTTCHAASCGMSHTLAIKKDGSVYSWGSNQDYQLGVEDLKESSSPVEVEGLSSVLSVAAGYSFSAALQYDGVVYEWGSRTDKTPRRVDGLSNIVDIVAGQTDLLALKSDGTVWQWTYGAQPAQVSGLQRVGAIAAGGTHYMALTCTGEVWAWGSNDHGQLGIGTQEDQSAPVRVESLIDVLDIAAGYSHSLAVTFDGTLYTWGSNDNGQLGTGKTEDSPVPVALKSIKAVRVSAGNGSSLAITEKGELYAWGYGEYGQLGQKEAVISKTSPVKISSNQGTACYIASGVNHNLVLNEDHALYVWGRNKDFQIGNKRNTNANQPIRILSPTTALTSYDVGLLDDLDSWAKEDISQLYDLGLVAPLLWGNYQSNLTRAEMAHILVGLYEEIRGNSASAAKDLAFTDLNGHLLERDIRKACQLGLLSGTSEKTVSPDRTITRQEAAKMLCSFLGRLNNEKISDKAGSLAALSDADQISDWAASSVYYVYKNHIMNGDAAGNFRPSSSITRQEILSIISRLAQQNQWGSQT